MPDDRSDAPLVGEELTADAFDPASLPLGTFAAFDVSDQPNWTNQQGENQLTDDQKNAIKAMVDAAGRADTVARRIEVQGAWMLELLDRGFHRLVPDKQNGGWQIYGSFGPQASRGIYGASAANNYHDTNVIGEKNDIIVSLLTREIAEATFFPEKPGNPDDQCYAEAANCLKYFVADENKYGKRQGEIGRFFCTDETAWAYTRPVADAQRWGYEDTVPDVVPETADGQDPDVTQKQSKQPKIRPISTVFGKLCRKVPMMAKSKADMQYAMISEEWDIAKAKATFPWVAQQITAGDLGISELKLDRLARQSIHLSMQTNYATGDSLQRDCTVTRVWFRPGFYMDESCPKALRSWFWQNFDKGMLAVYAGGVLAFCRNEGMDEVLTEFHAHTGNGQNRRALTESYAGPQMRLNVLVDLWDEFCRKEIPRVGLLASVWNVPAIRSSSVRVGVIEPVADLPPGMKLADTMAQLPSPTHQATMPDFIQWLAGPLAEQLTHATQALSGSQDNKDPEQTATESKLKDDNSMSSFGEAWKDICEGFANITTQAASWAARVLPEDTTLAAEFPGLGKKEVVIKNLKMGSGVARADGTANFPESWADRAKAWNDVFASPNPIAQQIASDPRNLAAARDFMPRGVVLPGVDAVEKQEAEFDVLLKTPPQDNPQYVKLEELVEQGTQAMQAEALQGIPPDPQKQAMLQQAQQMLQTLPPMISSVPVLKSDNDAVEALVCEGMINSARGRQLASSKDPNDQAIFENLNLHWQQHVTNAAQKAATQQKPIPPKTSITVAADKLPPDEQASALQVAGIAANPQNIQQHQMEPHEVSTTERGVGPTGSEIERKVSVAGKPLG